MLRVEITSGTVAAAPGRRDQITLQEPRRAQRLNVDLWRIAGYHVGERFSDRRTELEAVSAASVAVVVALETGYGTHQWVPIVRDRIDRDL